MSGPILLGLAVLISSAMTAFFAGAETGTISANRLRLRNLQLKGDRRADEVIALLSDTQSILTVTLVGTNVFSIFAALFARQFFANVIPAGANAGALRMEDLLSLVVMTPFLLIFGEIMPKQILRERADSLMLTFRKPLGFFSTLFIPAVGFLNAVTYFLLKIVGVRKGKGRTRFTKEDLRNLVGSVDNVCLTDALQTHNVKDSGTSAQAVRRQAGMIHSIFDLEKTLVREVMKPLVDVVALPLHTSSTQTVIETARRTGYTRFPVYENTIVNMMGYVDIYDILRTEEGDSKPLGAYVREPYYVPETKRIDDLLQELLTNHIPVAIAIDEYGGCSGFVTLEDILEEIVGEIEDEFDKRSILYYREKSDVFVVDARMDLDDLRDELNISLPKRNCETLGGFIYNTLGRVPESGEVIKYREYSIYVLDVKPPKILHVRIEHLSTGKQA